MRNDDSMYFGLEDHFNGQILPFALAAKLQKCIIYKIHPLKITYGTVNCTY
jgi:hypothetical protein